jgi:hypothetical protein
VEKGDTPVVPSNGTLEPRSQWLEDCATLFGLGISALRQHRAPNVGMSGSEMGFVELPPRCQGIAKRVRF